MNLRFITVAVTAVCLAAVTAAPLSAEQPPRAVAETVALPTPLRAVQPLPQYGPQLRLRVRQTAEPERKSPEARSTPTTVIGAYAVCNTEPQPCIDAGSLTLYGQPYGVSILAGHNYQGYQWLSRLPVGHRVTVASGPVAGAYQVTGHLRLNRQAGALPPFGGAALVLQSCEGAGTGFSLLRRIN